MLKSDPLHELKEREHIHGIPTFGKAFYGSNGCEEHNMHQKTARKLQTSLETSPHCLPVVSVLRNGQENKNTFEQPCCTKPL